MPNLSASRLALPGPQGPKGDPSLTVGPNTLALGSGQYPKGDGTTVVAGDFAADVAATNIVSLLTAKRYDVAAPAYGAVAGSVSGAQQTTNTAAINAAAADAATNDGVLVIRGAYQVNGTVTAACHVDASAGRLDAFDESIAPVLRFGGTAANSASHRIALLPVVYQNTKAGGNGVWGIGVGVEIRSVNQCLITVPWVQGFGTNLKVTDSSSGGCSYNHIDIGHLDNGKINLDVAPVSPGWCNENKFYVGRFSQNSAEGTNVSGVRHIRLTGYGTGSGANNCTFYSPSIERDTPEYHVELNQATDNVFLQARWEATTPKVLLANASNNVFFYGYDAHLIQFTYSGTSQYNHWYHRNGMRQIGSLASGVAVLGNLSSSANPSLVVLDSSANLTTDPAASYNVAIGANLSNYKRTADTQPRITLDHQNSKLSFGSGTAAADVVLSRIGSPALLSVTSRLATTGAILPGNGTTQQYTAGIYGGAGSPEGVITASPGSLYQRTDGGAATSLYVKESGTGNTGWIGK